MVGYRLEENVTRHELYSHWEEYTGTDSIPAHCWVGVAGNILWERDDPENGHRGCTFEKQDCDTQENHVH